MGARLETPSEVPNYLLFLPVLGLNLVHIFIQNYNKSMGQKTYFELTTLPLSSFSVRKIPKDFHKNTHYSGNSSDKQKGMLTPACHDPPLISGSCVMTVLSWIKLLLQNP